MVGPIELSTVGAGIATFASIVAAVNDLLVNRRVKRNAPEQTDKQASVVVEMPNGQESRIEISIEDAKRLLQQVPPPQASRSRS